MKKQFKNIYNHVSPVSPHGGESLTDQQYRAECDINHILKVYGATGRLPVHGEGVSGDFSSIGDYQACLDKINKAKDEFMALPSEIRSRFGHDPAAYVEFVLDPANTKECIRLGIKEEIVETPTESDLLSRIVENTDPKNRVSPQNVEGVA